MFHFDNHAIPQMHLNTNITGAPSPTTTVDPLYEPGMQPRCNFLCPDSRDNVLVCGSDGVTYLSECYLNWLNCRRNARISVAYNGPCIIVGMSV